MHPVFALLLSCDLATPSAPEAQDPTGLDLSLDAILRTRSLLEGAAVPPPRPGGRRRRLPTS